MYRQRKRDLNLKPCRQLDKRSSRGMIYENEELRMRTIAICEDVDRGQSDIKKLRKENDYLKREIWGLRDECERLEGVLKKVCISANIPEFELETPSKSKGGDDDEEDGSEDSQDEDEEEDDDDDEGSYGEEEDEDVPPDKYLKAGGTGASKNKKKRRASGASVTTFDSEVGSCISNMFGDEKPPEQFQQEEIGFAAEDPGSVILNPEQLTSEPIAGSSGGGVYQPWQASPHPPHQTHPTAPSDLEILREESEGSLSSPGIPTKPIERKGIGFENISDPIPQTDENLMDYLAFPGDDRKTPLIHITPASSPTSNSNETANSVETEESNNGGGREETSQSCAGLITVVPKTFKVTSEILVGSESKFGERDEDEVYVPPPMESKTTELSRKQLLPGSGGICQRRSFYLPTGTLPLHSFSTIPHRAFGIPGHCCCTHLHSHPHHLNNDQLFGGCQSEPSLTSSPQQAMPPTTDGIGPHSSVTSFFNNFCCRGGPAETPLLAAASPSMWNTVDKNIVIGFYGYSTASQTKETNLFSNEPSVQEIIDRLEAEFDPTLENILGIRLIPPGRLFISLKNSSVVKSFLNHFKNDLILTSKLNPSQKLRIHFIEGTTTKLTTTLVLSGIPPELPDLSVISVLNQFGQVVAPLERRNYKGIDISERIVKMHLVVREGSLPEFVNVSGYEVRINRAEENETDQTAKSKLTLGQKQAPTGTSSDYATKTSVHHQRIQPQRKYGFIDPTTVTIPPEEPTSAVAPTPTGPTTTLKPHKPVIRSSSSAPRLETPVPGTLPSSYPLPPIEQKRQSSVCVGNIPSEQHPSKISHLSQPKITQQPTGSAQTSSVPNLQPPPVKKPLARLLVSSPGSLPQSPIGSPGSPFPEKKSEGPLKSLLYKGFDPKASVASSEKRSHGPLTPSSSYSPKTKRKNSGVQFASGNLNKPGKKHREPLPWCGCWGLGCGINEQK